MPRLSRREWEVLSLAAAGRSYGEIAGQLYISTGTVRKHMDHVRERLARFKVPQSVRFVGEIPRNSLGKIQKQDLLEVVG